MRDETQFNVEITSLNFNIAAQLICYIHREQMSSKLETKRILHLRH